LVELAPGYEAIAAKHPKVTRNAPPQAHLGTLGTGNHFIEVCLDEADNVWFLLHSGSRGIGNRIGVYFIEKAREEMRQAGIDLPDRDLAYLTEGTRNFDDYVEAVGWAQDYARANRQLMMEAVVQAWRSTPGIRPFEITARW
jgi:tRNA-splicing ligase RtcB